VNEVETPGHCPTPPCETREIEMRKKRISCTALVAELSIERGWRRSEGGGSCDANDVMV